MGKALTEIHVQALAKKGETPLIKGLLKGTAKVNAKLKLNAAFQLVLIE